MSQLIQHERIETTVARAKELRKVADKMISLGKEVGKVANSPVLLTCSNGTLAASVSRMLLQRLSLRTP